MTRPPDRPEAASPPAADPLAPYDYDLPPDRIARAPAERREAARLLVLGGSGLADRRVVDLPDLLEPGDLLLANDTRVMRARLRARRATGGRVELLLLEPGEGSRARAMARPGRRLKAGEVLDVLGEAGPAGRARLEARHPDGTWTVACDPLPTELMARAGHVPLPPYIDRPDGALDRERYQTVFAGPLGAVAAPTAGLHLGRELLDALARRGVGFATVTLHVGPGTFRNLRPEDLARGVLHEEPYTVPPATAEAIAATRRRGGRVVAVGTTSTRTLESAAAPDGTVRAGSGRTGLFIRPGHRFRVVDALLTNFHLPRSSLLMLVAAFAGRERVLAAYRHAVARGYRFYSYGDAMLLLPDARVDSATVGGGAVDAAADVGS